MQNKKLKNVLIIFIILIICLISFIGIYSQEKNQIVNIIPDYLLGANLKGSRLVQLKINDEKKTVVKDKDGNVVTDTKNESGEEMTEEELKQKEYTKIEEPINSEEVLKQENYEKSKQIIEKRLKHLKVTDFIIKQNEAGEIIIESEENDKTDNNMQAIYNTGKFEMKDSEDNTVLMDNKDIKTAKVLYSNSASSGTGTSVYVGIEFTKDGAKKLEDISKKYIKTTAEDGTETEKKVKIEIDGEKLIETYFDEPMTNGNIQLSVGTSTTDKEQLEKYVVQATNLAMILSCGELPITYEQANNEYVASDLTIDNTRYLTYGLFAVIAIAIIILIIKYKTKGLLGTISFIGFIATLLLIIRYSNVIINIEGIIAFIAILIVNYMLIYNLLKETTKQYNDKTNLKAEITKTFVKIVNVLIPLGIIGITFCFADWQPIVSLGMILFWGIVSTLIYNLIFTKTLLLNSIKKD